MKKTRNLEVEKSETHKHLEASLEGFCQDILHLLECGNTLKIKARTEEFLQEILHYYRLEVGRVVRRERIDAGLSQMDLSKILQCSHAYISRIERGAAKSREDTISAILQKIKKAKRPKKLK